MEAADEAGMLDDLHAALSTAHAARTQARGAIQQAGLTADWVAESETSTELGEYLLAEGVSSLADRRAAPRLGRGRPRRALRGARRRGRESHRLPVGAAAGRGGRTPVGLRDGRGRSRRRALHLCARSRGVAGRGAARGRARRHHHAHPVGTRAHGRCRADHRRPAGQARPHLPTGGTGSTGLPRPGGGDALRRRSRALARHRRGAPRDPQSSRRRAGRRPHPAVPDGRRCARSAV